MNTTLFKEKYLKTKYLVMAGVGIGVGVAVLLLMTTEKGERMRGEAADSMLKLGKRLKKMADETGGLASDMKQRIAKEMAGLAADTRDRVMGIVDEGMKAAGKAGRKAQSMV